MLNHLAKMNRAKFDDEERLHRCTEKACSEKFPVKRRVGQELAINFKSPYRTHEVNVTSRAKALPLNYNEECAFR